MKIRLILFLFNLLGLRVFAQSTLLLPNSLTIPKVMTLATCNAASKGNQVYYTPQNKMYYCNGSTWSEMSVGLPYDESKSSVETLFSIENTGTGRAIHAKSNGNFTIHAESINGQGVRGESNSGIGIYGISDSNDGIAGYSNTGYGVYATSATNTAAYFSNNGTDPTLHVINFGTGKAASFLGDVQISKDLMVNQSILINNRGLIQNSSSTQLKYDTETVAVSFTIAAFSTVVSGIITLATFAENPIVYVGNVASQTGEYYKIVVTPISVTTNSVRLRLYNASNTESTFSATYHIVAIGTK